MKFLPLCLALLCGCATPIIRPYVGYIAPRAINPSWLIDIAAYCQTRANHLAPDRPTDDVYFCPTAIQIQEMDRDIRPKLHLHYVAQAWDCDDMAWEWRLLCHRWAVENITRGQELPIAVFICYADVEKNAFDGRLSFEGRHALGLLCDSNGTWWYVEPKLGYRVKVTEALLEGSIQCYKIVW